MPKAAPKKKKVHLDKNTKNLAIAIAVGGSLLVVTIIGSIVLIASRNRPGPGGEVKDDSKDLATMLTETDDLEKELKPGMGDRQGSWKWERMLDRHKTLAASDFNGVKQLERSLKGLGDESEAFKELSTALQPLAAHASNRRLTAMQRGELGQKLTNVAKVIQENWTNEELSAELLQLAPELDAKDDFGQKGAFPLTTSEDREFPVKGKKTKETKKVDLSPYEISTAHLESVRRGKVLLFADALHKLHQGAAADEKDREAPIRAFFAILRIADYLKLEPLWMAQHMRIESQLEAVTLLEHILAQRKDLSQDVLRKMQLRLKHDLEQNDFIEMIRVARAEFVRTCELAKREENPTLFPTVIPHGGQKIGKEPTPSKDTKKQKPPPKGKGNLGKEQAELDEAEIWYLQYMNHVLGDARGKSSELLAKIVEWNDKSPKPSVKAVGFVPPCSAWAELYLKKVARMRLALIALAAERYRLHKGGTEWPAKLEELIGKDGEPHLLIVSEVPRDPFTEKEFVYEDEQDGKIIRTAEESGRVVTFRLWNADKRHLEPPKADKEKDQGGS
jgi:hypothetical protein